MRVAFLEADELKARFPFINFDDCVAGTYGLENEGIFDTWQLLSAIREKNITLGVQYVKGEVEGFEFDYLRSHQHSFGYKPYEESVEDARTKKKLRGVMVIS